MKVSRRDHWRCITYDTFSEIEDSHERLVCHIYGPSLEREAEGKLISAAPDMAEALLLILTRPATEESMLQALHLCRAALRKARVTE